MKMGIEERLKNLSQQIEQGKNRKMKAEVRREALLKEQAKLLEDCKALGVKPEDLEAEISRMEEQLDTKISEIEALLPEGV